MEMSRASILKKTVCLILFLATSLSSCSFKKARALFCPNSFGQEVIRVRAYESLDRFCETRGINQDIFVEPPFITYSNSEGFWQADFESTANGNLFVRFIFDDCGGTETSFGEIGTIKKIE